MDVHVDIRGFLEIHAWICYGFSDQGSLLNSKIRYYISFASPRFL